MSSRHHIDDFMRGRIIGKIEEGRKITDVARSSTSLTALFHGCGSHLKLLECVVDGTAEVVLEVRRLQKTDISSYQQKGTGAPQLSSLSSDCRRQLIWRESGTAYRPENIQEKDRYPTCSIMVWAGIMINGRTRLHVVANGTMTGQRYIDEVLLPHVRLFRGAVDLNPIENVWDALGRQVAGRNYPPTNKNTLIRALTEEWDELPQQLLDNVVQSLEAVGLSESEDLINEVLDDAPSVMNLTEEERQERISRKKKNK
ncbi:transposable element Tcb2 transposase [Trichonephila clavipes]|nr:transposable element Tcb2 transposase [Trichonephila clavipes]